MSNTRNKRAAERYTLDLNRCARAIHASTLLNCPSGLAFLRFFQRFVRANTHAAAFCSCEGGVHIRSLTVEKSHKHVVVRESRNQTLLVEEE
jgi:hypothetical protein